MPKTAQHQRNDFSNALRYLTAAIAGKASSFKQFKRLLPLLQESTSIS